LGNAGNDVVIGARDEGVDDETTRDSVVGQNRRPRGYYHSVVVEMVAIIGLVGVNAVALVTRVYGPEDRMAVLTGLATWIYTLVLTTCRLALSHAYWRIPKLWAYTTVIYVCQ
jgi:hypothetical protein